MLIVETIARIRREHFIKGKTIKEIARDLKVSRNTVRKVLRSGETSFEYERAVQPRPKLGRWASELDGLLIANVAKSAREQLTLIRIFEELRYRELDDALGLTALAGDVLADARTGKNGRHAVAIGVRPSRWLRECERCRTSSSRSCNALDRRRQGAPGPRGFAKPDGPLVFIK